MEPVDVDGRNVCYKLCSLIHSQLIKAHAEVSRYVFFYVLLYVRSYLCCDYITIYLQVLYARHRWIIRGLLKLKISW